MNLTQFYLDNKEKYDSNEEMIADYEQFVDQRYPDEAYGEQIHLVHELDKYAKEKRSVVCPTMWGVLPCTVVLNMQARLVLQTINEGLYLYIPKSQRKNKQNEDE